MIVMAGDGGAVEVEGAKEKGEEAAAAEAEEEVAEEVAEEEEEDETAAVEPYTVGEGAADMLGDGDADVERKIQPGITEHGTDTEAEEDVVPTAPSAAADGGHHWRLGREASSTNGKTGGRGLGPLPPPARL